VDNNGDSDNNGDEYNVKSNILNSQDALDSSGIIGISGFDNISDSNNAANNANSMCVSGTVSSLLLSAPQRKMRALKASLTSSKHHSIPAFTHNESTPTPQTGTDSSRIAIMRDAAVLLPPIAANTIINTINNTINTMNTPTNTMNNITNNSRINTINTMDTKITTNNTIPLSMTHAGNASNTPTTNPPPHTPIIETPPSFSKPSPTFPNPILRISSSNRLRPQSVPPRDPASLNLRDPGSILRVRFAADVSNTASGTNRGAARTPRNLSARRLIK